MRGVAIGQGGSLPPHPPVSSAHQGFPLFILNQKPRVHGHPFIQPIIQGRQQVGKDGLSRVTHGKCPALSDLGLGD